MSWKNGTGQTVAILALGGTVVLMVLFVVEILYRWALR